MGDRLGIHSDVDITAEAEEQAKQLEEEVALGKAEETLRQKEVLLDAQDQGKEGETQQEVEVQQESGEHVKEVGEKEVLLEAQDQAKEGEKQQEVGVQQEGGKHLKEVVVEAQISGSGKEASGLVQEGKKTGETKKVKEKAEGVEAGSKRPAPAPTSPSPKEKDMRRKPSGDTKEDVRETKPKKMMRISSRRSLVKKVKVASISSLVQQQH